MSRDIPTLENSQRISADTLIRGGGRGRETDVHRALPPFGVIHLVYPLLAIMRCSRFPLSKHEEQRERRDEDDEDSDDDDDDDEGLRRAKA